MLLSKLCQVVTCKQWFRISALTIDNSCSGQASVVACGWEVRQRYVYRCIPASARMLCHMKDMFRNMWQPRKRRSSLIKWRILTNLYKDLFVLFFFVGRVTYNARSHRMRTFCSDLLGSKANENRQPKSITYVYVTFLPPIYGYTNLYTYNMYIHYIYNIL